MTREEAALKLSFHLMQCGMLMPIGWVDENGKGSELFEAFKMAQDALREQTCWISVEERLPEEWRVKGGDLVNYLVYMPEYGVDVGNYAKPVKTWLCMGIPCKVSHWMPLPEPPKERE